MHAASMKREIRNLTRRLGGFRCSTPWLALLAAAAVHAPAMAAALPCSGLDSATITAAEQNGSLRHEIGRDLRAESERDRRANEEEILLRNGIDCIADRINALTEATKRNQALAESRRHLIDDLLERLTTNVDALAQQTNGSALINGRPQFDVSSQQLGMTIKAVAADTDLLKKISESVDNISRESSMRAPPASNIAQAFASVNAPIPNADTHARDQLDPTQPISSYFEDPNKRISYAIAAIPDPRVPRHRREYDNAVTAISQGMLREHFVLDSYWFPWRKVLQRTGDQQTDDEGLPYALNDGRYGVMVFRSDGWRGKTDGKGNLVNDKASLSLHVLLLIPETATYGLQKAALRCALLDIDHGAIGLPKSCIRKQQPARGDDSPQASSSAAPNQEIPPGKRKNAAGSDPAGCAKASPEETVTLFGPNFSGSMDSIREVMLRVASDTTPDSFLVKIHCLRLISPSATVDSNRSMSKSTDLVRYTPLMTSDRNKLSFIYGLAGFLGVDTRKVAIVYESTVFGLEACSPLNGDKSPICDGTQIAVPVNIADVRYGLRQKMLSHASTGSGGLPLVWQSEHLSLADGAENGSEFPESEESPLTVTSTELEIDRLVAQLRSMRAEMIVVIATDVRDRLFLIQRIGSELGGGLFVDLGADRLLAHPDFLNATRGTLTLASSNLASTDNNRYQVWSTDEEATLAHAMEFWKPTTDPTPPPVWGVPYVVTRSGLMSGPDATGPKRLSESEAIGELFLALISEAAALAWICVAVKREGLVVGSSETAGSQSLRNPFLVVLAALVTGALWVSTGVLLFGVVGAALVWLYFTRYDSASLRWFRAMRAVLFIALGTMIFLQVAAAYHWAWRASPAGSYIRPMVIRLAAAPRGGLAFPLAQCVFGFEALGLLWIGRAAKARWQESKKVLGDAVGEANFEENVEVCGRSAGWIILSGGAAAMAIGCAAYWLTVRQVTVFGWWADTAIFVAVLTTTFLAFTCLLAIAVTGPRIKGLSRVVLGHIESMSGVPFSADAAEKTLWGNLSGGRPDFVATPVLASATSGGRIIARLRTVSNWELRAAEVLRETPTAPMGLKALYAIVAAEFGVYRLLLVGAAGSSIASSVMVYLFPVTHATALIVLNIVILLMTGAYAGYHTMVFESDGLLSNLLCNRPATPRWSIALLAGVWIPFVALAVVVGIGEVPGVLQMGDGIISVLIKWLKPGVL